MSKSSKMGRPMGWTNGDGKYSEFKKRNGMKCFTKVIKKKTKYNSKKPDIEHRKHLANERISNALFTHPEIPKRRILLLDDVYHGNANTSSVLKKNHRLSVGNFIIPNNDEEHYQKLKNTKFGDVVVKGDACDFFTEDIGFYYLDYCSTYSNITSETTPQRDINKLFKHSLFKEGCWLLFHVTHRNGKWRKEDDIKRNISKLANKYDIVLKPGPKIHVNDRKFLYFSYILHKCIVIDYKFFKN